MSVMMIAVRLSRPQIYTHVGTWPLTVKGHVPGFCCVLSSHFAGKCFFPVTMLYYVIVVMSVVKDLKLIRVYNHRVLKSLSCRHKTSRSSFLNQVKVVLNSSSQRISASTFKRGSFNRSCPQPVNQKNFCLSIGYKCQTSFPINYLLWIICIL